MMKKTGIIFASGIAAFALIIFIVVKVLPIGNIWADSLSEQEIKDKVSRQYGGEIVDFVKQDGKFAVELQQETGVYKLFVDAKSGEVISLQREDRDDFQVPDSSSEQNDENQLPGEEDQLDQPSDGQSNTNDPDNGTNNGNETNTGSTGNSGNHTGNTGVNSGNSGSNHGSTGSNTGTSGSSGSSTGTSGNSGNNKGNQTGTSTGSTGNDSEKKPVNPNNSVGNDKGASSEQPSKETPTPSRISADEAAQIAVNEIGGEVDDVELEEIGGSYYYLVEIEFDDDDQEAEVQIDILTGEIISIVWDD